MIDTKQLRAMANGFKGTFEFEPSHTVADLAEVIDFDDALVFHPDDGDGYTIAEQIDEHMARPIAEMLNAVPALLDENAALKREVERWRHGATIESDFVCPADLENYELRKALSEALEIAAGFSATAGGSNWSMTMDRLAKLSKLVEGK